MKFQLVHVLSLGCVFVQSVMALTCYQTDEKVLGFYAYFIYMSLDGENRRSWRPGIRLLPSFPVLAQLGHRRADKKHRRWHQRRRSRRALAILRPQHALLSGLELMHLWGTIQLFFIITSSLEIRLHKNVEDDEKRFSKAPRPEDPKGGI